MARRLKKKVKKRLAITALIILILILITVGYFVLDYHLTYTEELKPVTGWTLSSDKKTLTRVFSSNYTGTIVLEDLAGNKSNSIEIKVDTSLPNGGTNVDNAGAKTNSPVKATETSATDKLPKTGSAMIIPMIALAGLVGTFTYFKYRGMKY